MLKKLKGIDPSKLSPAQMRALAGAVAKSAKNIGEAGAGVKSAASATKKAKSAVSAGKKDLLTIDD